MKFKTRFTEETLAKMPLETRVDVQMEIEINPDTQIKRKNRIKAINNKNKKFHLDERKMAARLILAEKSIAARDSKNIITAAQKQNSGIYCSKTGAFIGRVDISALSFVNELEMPLNDESNAMAQWQTHHAIHPAWLNTSSSVLAQLQRIMPHEYCIYLYTYLIERHSDVCHSVVKEMAEIEKNKWHEIKTTCITTMPAPYKHYLLNQIYNLPLAEVIEIAELLRILAALLGKNKAIITAMPKMVTHEIIARSKYMQILFLRKYRNELLAFLIKALEKHQKKYHSRDIARANLITSAILYDIVSAHGMKCFAMAKIAPDEDNPVLGDVADLLNAADITPLQVAKYYSKVKMKPEKKKSARLEFSATVIPATTTILKPITL